MTFNEKIAGRIREALVGVKKLEEKKMFRGICFMVNDKMCICVNETEIMCRIGPDKYEEALEKNGCRPMIQNGKTMTGFVFVSDGDIKSKKELDYWIHFCLAFNKIAKASRKK